MIDFDRRIVDYNKCVHQESKFGSYRAQVFYERIKRGREEILQKVLKEKGLAVCSQPHDFEGIEKPSPEQLGIYPCDQMRLFYFEWGPYDKGDEYEIITTGHTKRLSLFCPGHFPQNLKRIFENDGEHTLIMSEVVRHGKKFILEVNGSDITQSVKQGGFDMQPEGMMPFCVTSAVYRFFGIPDLPQRPKQY